MHYCRYHGYDYARGAVVFATTSTEPRQRVFSRIEGGKAIPTEFGRMALHELAVTAERVPEVKLSRYALMPDHVHLLLWLTPGHGDGFLKWELMHTQKGLIPIKEPLDCAWLPDGTYWKGIGRCDLLDGSRKLCSVRISRRVEAKLFPEVLARLRKALEKGYCIVSTFLSPGERALYGMLAEAGAEFVHIKGTAIPVVYRPDIHETPLFAANRMLVLGRQTDERKVLRPDCLALNDAIAQMALASGGAATYVREGGRFDFFRVGASPHAPLRAHRALNQNLNMEENYNGH